MTTPGAVGTSTTPGKPATGTPGVRTKQVHPVVAKAMAQLMTPPVLVTIGLLVVAVEVLAWIGLGWKVWAVLNVLAVLLLFWAVIAWRKSGARKAATRSNGGRPARADRGGRGRLLDWLPRRRARDGAGGARGAGGGGAHGGGGGARGGFLSRLRGAARGAANRARGAAGGGRGGAQGGGGGAHGGGRGGGRGGGKNPFAWLRNRANARRQARAARNGGAHGGGAGRSGGSSHGGGAGHSSGSGRGGSGSTPKQRGRFRNWLRNRRNGSGTSSRGHGGGNGGGNGTASANRRQPNGNPASGTKTTPTKHSGRKPSWLRGFARNVATGVRQTTEAGKTTDRPGTTPRPSTGQPGTTGQRKPAGTTNPDTKTTNGRQQQRPGRTGQPTEQNPRHATGQRADQTTSGHRPQANTNPPRYGGSTEGNTAMGIRNSEGASLQGWGRNLKNVAPAFEEVAKSMTPIDDVLGATAQAMAKLTAVGESDLPASKRLVAEVEAISKETAQAKAEYEALLAKIRSLGVRAEGLSPMYQRDHDTDEGRLNGERGGLHRERRADVSAAEQDT